MKRIDIIQLLRFLGAFCVIVYHSGIAGEFGYFGVELFSFVSGYIMIYSTRSEQSDKKFLLKRGIRILPLYWLMTLFYYGIICVRPGLSVMSEAKPEYLIKSMLFIPFLNSLGYDTPILGAGWTLNYEVMFYLIFFLSMKISHRYRGMIAAGITVLFAAAGCLLPGDHFYLNYYSNSFLLEFSMGIGAFYLLDFISGPASLLTQEQVFRIQQLCLNAAALLFLWMIPFGGRIHEVPRFLYPGIPMFLFFCALLLAFKDKRLPGPLVELGNMSYSVYLIEYFTTALFKLTAGTLSFVPKMLAFLVMVAVTLACSYVSYVVVEKRFTGFLRRILCDR